MGNKWMTLLIIGVGMFMIKLDMSIVNLAISKMMVTFNATYDEIQWVLSAYSLALGIVTATTAFLTNRFGVRNMIIVAFTLFTLGSLFCGFSWNTVSIVTSRIVQGIGGGMLIPVGLAAMLTTFEEKERGLVFAVMGVCNMVAPALGPTLGGYLIDNVNWRLIFFINIPAGVLGIILSFIFLGDSEHKPIRNFDILGFLSSVLGLGCVLYVLGKGDIDWSDMENIILFSIGCFSLLIFIFHEWNAEKPMLDLKLFKDYNFSMSNIVFIIATMGLFGGIFLVPIFLQQLKTLTPLQAGMVLFPEAITSAISTIVASRLIGKVDPRFIGMLGLLLMAFNSINLTHLSFDMSNDTVTMLLLIRGLAFGFLVLPLQTIGFSRIAKNKMGDATALFQTIGQVGSSAGLTIITSFMQQRNTIDYARLASQVNSYSPNSADLMNRMGGILAGGGINHSALSGGALAVIYGTVMKQARLQAINETMLFLTFIIFMMIVPMLLLKKNKKTQETRGQVMMEG
jgi:EmrB/QacA subfamily drug resistance transporter